MEKYLPILRSSVIFQGMNDSEILAVLKCMNVTVMLKRKDEIILNVGDTIDFMGVLLSGSALIVQEDIWGRRNIMASIDRGDPFAESFAATNSQALNISVIASEDCEILKLSIDHILNVCPRACSHHSLMIRNLVSVLAIKNLMFNEKITHMSKRTTREKLLSYLSSQATKYGSLDFNIPYDRQQLADYLCVERAAMSVELSKLQNEGILKTNKNHFVLKKSLT